MPLDNSNRAFNPSSLHQEIPLRGQSIGLPGVLDDRRIVPLFGGTEANENKKTRKGAIDGFVRTCERWKLGKSDQIILLGYTGNDLAAIPVLDGRIRASQDVLDRTGYVLGISLGLAALFDNSTSDELAWLNHTHPDLSQTTPMDCMLQGRMTDMIRVFDLVSRERAL
jgi:hypothetical protein